MGKNILTTFVFKNGGLALKNQTGKAQGSKNTKRKLDRIPILMLKITSLFRFNKTTGSYTEWAAPLEERGITIIYNNQRGYKNV